MNKQDKKATKKMIDEGILRNISTAGESEPWDILNNPNLKTYVSIEISEDNLKAVRKLLQEEICVSWYHLDEMPHSRDGMPYYRDKMPIKLYTCNFIIDIPPTVFAELFLPLENPFYEKRYELDESGRLILAKYMSFDDQPFEITEEVISKHTHASKTAFAKLLCKETLDLYHSLKTNSEGRGILFRNAIYLKALFPFPQHADGYYWEDNEGKRLSIYDKYLSLIDNTVFNIYELPLSMLLMEGFRRGIGQE